MDKDKLTITIHLANAAFVDAFVDSAGAACGSEVARILRSLADKYEAGEGVWDMSLRDVNGNKVGTAELS